MMALCVMNLWELHHPAARVLPRSSPRLSRRTPSTSARIDTTDTSGVSATTPELPPILGRFMKADYGWGGIGGQKGTAGRTRHTPTSLQPEQPVELHDNRTVANHHHVCARVGVVFVSARGSESYSSV